jgi:hypothetical protein
VRPLELTIYPKLEPPRTGTEIMPYREQWQREAALSQAKHLTDAELAAEYHANEVEAWRMSARRPEFFNVDHAERLEERESILRRFATLPHYDEVQQ